MAKWAKDKIKEAQKPVRTEGIVSGTLSKETLLFSARYRLDNIKRGAWALNYVPKIRADLEKAGATPEDIGTTDDELAAFQKKFVNDAIRWIESSRKSPNGNIWMIENDLRDSGLEPQDLGTTWEEIRAMASRERTKKEGTTGREEHSQLGSRR